MSWVDRFLGLYSSRHWLYLSELVYYMNSLVFSLCGNKSCCGGFVWFLCPIVFFMVHLARLVLFHEQGWSHVVTFNVQGKKHLNLLGDLSSWNFSPPINLWNYLHHEMPWPWDNTGVPFYFIQTDKTPMQWIIKHSTKFVGITQHRLIILLFICLLCNVPVIVTSSYLHGRSRGSE